MDKPKEEQYYKIYAKMLKREDLNSTHKLFIIYIDSFKTSNLGVCTKKQKEIAEALGMSLRTISNTVNELSNSGVISYGLIRNMSDAKSQYKNRKGYRFNPNVIYVPLKKVKKEKVQTPSETIKGQEKSPEAPLPIIVVPELKQYNLQDILNNVVDNKSEVYDFYKILVPNTFSKSDFTFPDAGNLVIDNKYTLRSIKGSNYQAKYFEDLGNKIKTLITI